jgi:hypothetical protein
MQIEEIGAAQAVTAERGTVAAEPLAMPAAFLPASTKRESIGNGIPRLRQAGG